MFILVITLILLTLCSSFCSHCPSEGLDYNWCSKGTQSLFVVRVWEGGGCYTHPLLEFLQHPFPALHRGRLGLVQSRLKILHLVLQAATDFLCERNTIIISLSLFLSVSLSPSLSPCLSLSLPPSLSLPSSSVSVCASLFSSLSLPLSRIPLCLCLSVYPCLSVISLPLYFFSLSPSPGSGSPNYLCENKQS